MNGNPSEFADRPVPRPQSRLQLLGNYALLMLASLLPFELKTPLFRAGPFEISNVEVVLYAVILIWIAARMSGLRSGWTPLHFTAAFWALVILTSAVCAPVERWEAIKFALRSLGGCGLLFAAADLLRTPIQAARAALALVAGSCASAAAALAEISWPGAAAMLMSFKTQPSVTGPFVRASGTFQYANIASMFWEASLPVALALLLFWGANRPGRLWKWFGAAAVLLLMEALLLAASRAALLVSALVLAGMIVVSSGGLRRMRAPASLALAVLLLLFLAHLSRGELWALRLKAGNEAGWYKADYSDLPDRLTLHAGDTRSISITVRNAGAMTWPAKGKNSVKATYHWLDPDNGLVIIWDGARSALLEDVKPGAETKVEAWIHAPGEPGHYLLQWDMLQEDVNWFSLYGGETASVQVRVLDRGTGAALEATPAPHKAPFLYSPDRIELWHAAVRMWRQRPWLGVGPDNFRRLYGPELGLPEFDDRIHTNNLYIEMLVNSGLAGALAWTGLSLAVLWMLCRALREGDGSTKLLTLGLGAGICTFGLHGFVDYFFEFTPTYCQFWLMAGMAASLSAGRRDNEE